MSDVQRAEDFLREYGASYLDYLRKSNINANNPKESLA